MTRLFSIDNTLTNALYDLPHSFFVDHFFFFFSLIGSYGIVWVIIFLLFALNERRHHHHILIPLIVALTSAVISVNGFLKPFFGRIRPTGLHEGLVGYEYPADFSFPSLHTTLAFAGACVLAHYRPAWKRVYYATAFLIAFSRIYTGYHFVGDVIAGGLLGTFIAFVVCRYICLPHKESKKGR